MAQESENKILQKIDDFHKQSKYDSAASVIYKAFQTVSPKSEVGKKLYFKSLHNLFHRGKFDSMEIILVEAKKNIGLKKENINELNFYNALFISSKGSYKEAIEMMIEVAKGFESLGDQQNLASAYNSLGVYYKELENYEAAQLYFKNSLKINLKLQDDLNSVKAYNNLGSIFSSLNQLDSALVYYDKASRILENGSHQFLLAQNALNRGNILEKKSDYDGALKMFVRCLTICSKEGFDYGIVLSKLNIGNLSRITKNFNRSEQYLLEALELSRKLKLKKEETHTLKRLSWLKRDQNLFQEAYNYLVDYNTLNDSLITEKIKRETTELGLKYETEKKENEITQLSNEKLYQQFILAVMGIGVLILYILVMWWKNKHAIEAVKRNKEELQKKHLREVVETKDMELTAKAAQLTQVKQQLERIQEEVTKILNVEKIDVLKIDKVLRVFNKHSISNVIEDFDHRLTSDNEDFFKVLLKKYPDLSPSELKLCGYLRLNLSTKDLAPIMNRSVRTIETSRTLIRKKMKLEAHENLVSHLLSISINDDDLAGATLE